jgi:hypothetical protein
VQVQAVGRQGDIIGWEARVEMERERMRRRKGGLGGGLRGSVSGKEVREQW